MNEVMMQKPKAAKNASKFGMVLIPELKIDQEAQRKLSVPWVKAHAQEFDVDQLGYIVVNRRADGNLYVVDGQHRVELMRAVGWGDQKIHAEIFEGLSQPDEAELFNARNDRRAVRLFDKFRISVVARDPEAIGITNIVHRCGLVISDQASDGNVVAVAALQRIYRGGRIAGEKEGAQALFMALTTLRDAFGKIAASFHGELIEAIGLIYLRYGKAVDQKTLVKKLSPISAGAPGLIGKGRSMKEMRGKSLAHNIASIVVSQYNKGARTGKLESWDAE